MQLLRSMPESGFLFYFSAKALQTILVLTGKQDLQKRWADSSEYLTVDWTEDSAKEVLEAWQRKFTEVYTYLSVRSNSWGLQSPLSKEVHRVNRHRGCNPYNLFGSASGQDEGNPVFRLATRVGTMNRSLVACSRHWEKLERPGNEAGIFGFRRSFTEQACSVKVAF